MVPKRETPYDNYQVLKSYNRAMALCPRAGLGYLPILVAVPYALVPPNCQHMET